MKGVTDPLVRRQTRTVIAGLVLILVSGLLAAGFLTWQWLGLNQSAQARIVTDDKQEATAQLVVRGQSLIQEDNTAGWQQQLRQKRRTVADYFLRLFVSPDYLSMNGSDEDFIRDSWLVATGEAITDRDLQQAVNKTRQSGSRIAWLQDVIDRFKLGGQLTVSADTTQVRTFALADGLPEEGSRVMGLLPVTAEIRLNGDQANLRLYTDNQLNISQAVHTEIQADSDQHTVYWDTRYEQPGRHDLSLLVQTSDGRGQWISLNSYQVPKVSSLTQGQLLPDILDQAATQETIRTDQPENWYRLDVTDNRALINLMQPDGKVDLTLYNLLGQLVASSASRDFQPAALRYIGQEEDLVPAVSGTAEGITSYYICVQSAETAEQLIHYTLIPSESVAVPNAGPARMLAVLAQQDDQLFIQDETGARSWQAAEDYSLISFTGRLSALTLRDELGTVADFYPVFERETDFYGLYVPENSSQLSFDFLLSEGSAASAAVTLTDEAGQPLQVEAGRLYTLQPSVNELSLTITGFDGQQKTYAISILRPPQTDGYETVLHAFPLSYRTRLWYNHLLYPAWEFKANNTGIDWETFLAAEDVGDLSLVNETSSPSSWVEVDSPIYDGTSWKAATRAVISYFADPRNALDPIDLFQFEELTYVQTLHTYEGVQAMIADSFMAADNEQGLDYAGMIMQAGEEANISPFFLAAKIIQEMGRQGQSDLAFGRLPDFEGYFNFYNIGSTPDPAIENGALINGAKFARYGRNVDEGLLDADELRWLLPWTSPEKAISGGAVWIAERYVGIGQDTIYGQKFDLIADPDLFQRQYAQNIQMAWSEGRSTRKAYRELDLLDQPFVFKIPVFNNMPDKPATWP